MTVIRVDHSPELDAQWAEAKALLEAIDSLRRSETISIEQVITLGASCTSLVQKLAHLHARTQQHLFKNIGGDND